jgi:hypothetical protein
MDRDYPAFGYGQHFAWVSPKMQQALDARKEREEWARKVNASKPVTPRGSGRVLPSIRG